MFFLCLPLFFKQRSTSGLQDTLQLLSLISVLWWLYLISSITHLLSAKIWSKELSFIAFSLPLPVSLSGPYGRVSEEDRGQRGSHLHQQRHSILHGGPHPHPGAQSLFPTGIPGSDSVRVCVCVRESSVVWGLIGSRFPQTAVLLISFIKLSVCVRAHACLRVCMREREGECVFC